MQRILLTIAFVLVPTIAFAHVGVGDVYGISHGFMHPLTGADHILAMVGVGMLAAQLGGRAIWLVPLSFMTMMAVGGALGMAGLAMPFAETGIGLSIVALGAMIAFEVSLPDYPAMMVVACLAIFHGHAHGAEMLESASGLYYGFGFVAATGLLHLFGVSGGILLQSLARSRFLRSFEIVGAAMALAGVGVLADVI